MDLTNYPANAIFDKTLSDSFYVNAGETKNISVSVDFKQNVNISLRISASIDVGNVASTYIKDIDTNKYISADQVTPTSVNGNTHNLRVATLTVDFASTPTATTYVKGAKNVKLAGFTFRA